ncbi:MAG: cupin domain-containing protein [Chloroflexi bacterium]|nr:cupin domain-containing protein [Chloroflexota bacterium]
MTFTLIDRSQLPQDGNTFEFEGYHYALAEVSFIWIDMPPGGGVALHQHPYREIFIIQEGTAAFTVGEKSLEAKAGNIIIAPANTPHKFINIGSGPLRQVDIHLSDRFVTDWLEE